MSHDGGGSQEENELEEVLARLKRRVAEQQAANPQPDGPKSVGALLGDSPEIEQMAKKPPTVRSVKTSDQAPTKPAEKINQLPSAIPAPGSKVVKSGPRVLQGNVSAFYEAKEVVYQHSVLCQTVMPYRDPGDLDHWSRSQGDVHLSLAAGEAFDGNEFVRVPLPFGPKARLALYHLNAQAIKTQQRQIEVGDSLTAFVKRLGLAHHGRNVRTVKEQLTRLSASHFSFGTVISGRPTTLKADVVRGFDLWESSDVNQRVLWPSYVEFSQEYFESLVNHAVPLNEHAVASLSHTAMGLDIYTWLAQRLHRVNPQRPQFIPWPRVYEQFGQGYKRLRDFRKAFNVALKQVHTVYPEGRFRSDGRGLLLQHSKPPISKQTYIPKRS